MIFSNCKDSNNSEAAINSENMSYKPPIWLFWRARRYVITFLIFLGFINTYCLRVNLSVAIVAMTEQYNATLENGSTILKRDFDWDSKLQGYLLSSFFYGYIFTQLLGAYLGVRYGGKLIFAVGIGVASILTILTPYVAGLNFYLLLLVRILEGLFEGLIISSCQSIWSNWAPPLERSRLMTAGLCGSYIGTVICLPISSALASSLGWPSIFYVFGGVGLVWCIFWMLLVSNSPSEDKRISKEELKYITDSLLGFQIKKDAKIPLSLILSSTPVWAAIVAVTCEIWGFYTLLTQLPKFMKYVLKFDLAHSGIVSALPYVAIAFMVHFAGHVADWIETKNFDRTLIRKMFVGIGFAVQCVFIITSVHWLSPISTTFCLVLALGFGGFAMAGFSVNNMDLSPQFSGILLGIGNTFATISGIVSPILTGYIVTDESDIYQWRIIFYIAGAIYFFGATVFYVWGSAKLQPWDDILVSTEGTHSPNRNNDNLQQETEFTR